MKKILTALALGLLVSTVPAFANPFWVGDVTAPGEGAGGTDVVATDVYNFDWSSSGSGAAVGIGPYGTPITAGTNFTFLYQAELVGVSGTGGNPITFTGLTSDFEFTVVATVPETVTAVSYPFFPTLLPNTAYFETLAGGTFYIYYDDVPNSDVATGYGFDDGVLVASGTIIPGQDSSFTANTATSGSGSFIFDGLVNYANPLYLDPVLMNGDPWIVGFRAEGTLNVPPLDSDTNSFFGGDVAGAYATYTVDDDSTLPSDLILKVDASSKFTVVPEPSTILLLGCGLLGLVGVCRRKNR